MRAVVQRVSFASVEVDGRVVGQIGTGLVVFLGVHVADTERDVAYTADKVSGLRVFPDDEGKMNLSVRDVDGSILAISQFTLFGDVRRGKRPSFVDAAPPDVAIPLYEAFCEKLAADGLRVERGVFGAMMRVSLVNEGPVTIQIDSTRLY